MRLFKWSLMFAFVWVAMTGALTLPNLGLGFVFGTVSLFLFREQMRGGVSPEDSRPMPILKRLWRIGSLLRLFLYELLMSAIKVAGLVLRRDMNLKSGIFAFETVLTKDSHISLLANLITLTPGTLTIDVSKDKRRLYIHAVDCSDLEASRADIRNGFEKKIREAFGDLI